MKIKYKIAMFAAYVMFAASPFTLLIGACLTCFASPMIIRAGHIMAWSSIGFVVVCLFGIVAAFVISDVVKIYGNLFIKKDKRNA